MTHIIKC